MSTFITLKRLLIVVCLVPVLALTSYGQSIVNNGDFESWTAGVPDGWTTIDPGITVTEATSPVHGGSKSASVDVTTGTQGNTDFRQTVSVVGGTDYDVSVWVYHTEGFMKARLYVGTYLSYSDNSIVGSWQELTYTYSAASAGNVEIGLRFYDQSGFDGAEIVYVDDFTMTPTGGGGPTTDQIFFEPFESDLGQTNGISIVGAQVWEFGNFGLPAGCSLMNGFDGGAQDNEDWLITNSIDCSNFTNVTLRFDHARNYGDNSGLSVLVSTDYDGTSDPNGFTWTDLTGSFTFPASGTWTFSDAGTVDINALVGPSTYVAFKYISTTAGAATWEVDNITVAGEFNLDVFVAGSFNGWSANDPAYEMDLNDNGVMELTKNLAVGTHEYKVVDDGNWYPGSNNQMIVLAAATDVTWKCNYSADLVTHTLPVVAGNFLSAIGGNDWDPTDLTGEMVDPEGDDIFILELTIPAGNYEAKVTLNHNWDQSTGGNVPFVTDGVTPTTFTYDFATNTTTITGPAPPAALVTFIVDDATGKNYDGFALKGSWDANGQYDPAWGNGMEHSIFYDDGTNGDVTAGDHIWTCQQDLVVDGGSNNWEWGVNDSEGNWIAGNWVFTVPTDVPQTLSWTVPTTPALIINEIMYNSVGADEEWIELYNATDQPMDLENWKVLDNDAGHSPIVIPAGYSIPAYGYFTIEVATSGAFPFVPDYDGSGNFNFTNTTDVVRLYNADGILIDIVSFTDSSPWPTSPDGNGPSLSLFSSDLDNSLAENWRGSNQDNGSPGEINFPINILTPNGGEMIDMGSNYEITWTVNGWDGNINIDLIREGHDPMLLVSNMPVSVQTFSWYVFNNLDVASDYKIMISATDGGNPFDVSDDYFALVQPFIPVPLVITEIMYNPPESGTDSLEFIEIYNNGADAVDMNGFSFSKGIEYEFTNVIIQPSEYLLVAYSAAAMQSTFGVTAYQWTSGGLNNGGEDLELVDAANNIIDFVSYDDALPWDTLADGYGPSLTLCNPNLDNNVAENWTHSINFVTTNAAGDSIWATPGMGCANTLIAGFEGTPTQVVLGGSVMFTDLSFGSVTQWTWTFEGGTPATFDGQTPPEIFYNEEGAWDVTLLVSDGVNTDEVTMMDYITVIDLPAPINLQATVGPNDDVTLTWLAPGTVGGFEDDFESYEDFAIDFSPWVNLDVDGSSTYGMENVEWPNAYTEQAFIIFNPSQTLPPVDDIIPHSGDKLAACFAATAPPNNDWMITPEVLIQSGYNVSFFAKSYTDQYGLERFKVGVSTTGLNPEDFTIISEGAYVEAPAADWTEFTYDLGAYAGQMVYVGIQCVSNDAFILLVDDISISATKSSIVYNPSQPIIGKGIKDISVVSQPTVQPAATVQTSRGINAELLGYNVYRDAVQINADMVTLTEYYDEMPSIGTHEYYVTAVYDAGESGMSNVVTILITGVDETSVHSIKVYPNPSNGMFTIEMPEIAGSEMVIMDVTGQIVYRNVVQSSDQINLSGIEKGLYFIQIADHNSGQKVIKKLLIN